METVFDFSGQPSISKSEDKEEIEIDITDDDHAWVERR